MHVDALQKPDRKERPDPPKKKPTRVDLRVEAKPTVKLLGSLLKTHGSEIARVTEAAQSAILKTSLHSLNTEPEEVARLRMEVDALRAELKNIAVALRALEPSSK